MPRCNGCSADDDYDDFGHFIFKADFEHFLEFLDSRTQEVNSKTPHCLSNETSLNFLRIFVTKLQPFLWEVFFPKVWQRGAAGSR